MSNRQLKLDEHFVPCPEEEDDELYPNGIFVFNITHLLAYLQCDKSRILISEAQVSDFPRYNDGLDQDYVDNTDLKKPVILAELARMEKARKNNVATVPCYRVPPTVLKLSLNHKFNRYLRQSRKLRPRVTQNLRCKWIQKLYQNPNRLT